MADGRRESRQVRRAQARGAGKSVSSPSPWKMERFAVPLLLLAGFVAYQNAMNGVFVLDDFRAIQRNVTIRTLWPPGAVLSPPGGDSAVTRRPLVNLSLALNYAWDGLNVPSYHAFNIAAHLLVAVALFGVIRRTLRSPVLRPRYENHASGIATAVALLWVVHPLTTDAVDYTVQRSELLMGLFFLLTLYCSIRTFESPGKWGWPIAAVGAFALGAGCKQVIVVAPAVVLASDWLFWSDSLRGALRRHLRLYAGFAAALAIFIFFAGTAYRHAHSRPAANGVTSWDYLKTSSGVIVHYLRLAVWPNGLSADYDGWPIASSLRSVLPSFTAVAGLVALTLFGLIRRSALSFLGVWFFLILAPTTSVLVLSREVVAERRMYLPLAAVILLLVLAGGALLRSVDAPRGAGVAIVAGLALTLALLTMRRNEDYRSTLSFWTDVVNKRPDNPRARIWLGDYFASIGQRAEAVRYRSEAERLLRRRREDGDDQYHLAMVLSNLGKTDESIEHYRQAYRIDPTNASAHSGVGRELFGRGEIDGAIREFREALRIDPNHANAHYNLGVALGKQNRTAEEIEHLEEAIRLNPDFQQARNELDLVRKRGKP